MPTELKDAVIGADVGGTTTDMGFVTVDGQVSLPFTIQGYNQGGISNGNLLFNRIADRLYKMREPAREQRFNVVGVSVAIPSPADMDQGIFLDDHKFPDLEGVNLTDILTTSKAPKFFLNDVDAFGLGVAWKMCPDIDRLMCLTLGTGLGSAFLVDGHFASESDGAPPDNEVWNIQYYDRDLEKLVSRDFIAGVYQVQSGQKLEVIDIADLARNYNNAYAQEAFRVAGLNLRDGLEQVITSFRPDTIVFGGGISNALDLFGPAMRTTGILSQLDLNGQYQIGITQARTPYLPVIGAAKYVFDKLAKTPTQE